MLLLLGFLTFVWIFGNLSESRNFSYTLVINPLPVLVGITREASIVIWIPGINFESKLKENFSLNFELNNVFLIFPFELEVGVREYLKGRGIEGFYLYQGLAGMLTYFFNGKFEVIPNLVLTFGDKYISRKGFTLDRFIGLKIVYGGGFFSEYLTIGSLKFGILPALGLYLCYSW